MNKLIDYIKQYYRGMSLDFLDVIATKAKMEDKMNELKVVLEYASNKRDINYRPLIQEFFDLSYMCAYNGYDDLAYGIHLILMSELGYRPSTFIVAVCLRRNFASEVCPKNEDLGTQLLTKLSNEKDGTAILASWELQNFSFF